jgi:hypothetical protein
MADHIGKVPVSCTQIIYMLLYTLRMDIAISAVYTPYFDV